MKTDTTNIKNWYVSAFRDFEKSMNGMSKTKVHDIRKKAAEMFEHLGFPTTKNEEWKYTNTSPVLKYNFQHANGKNSKVNKLDFEILDLINKLEANLLVFVNGIYNESLSDIKDTKNIRIMSLAEAMINEQELFNSHFAKYASIDNGFNALNTAFSKDGAFIHVNKGSIIEKPVYLLFLSGDDKENIVTYPRNLIISEANSSVTIVEHFFCLSNNTYFTNTVTEIFSGENTVIDYYKLQQEDFNAFHISKTQAHLEKNSNFTHTLISTGGALVRNDLNSVMDGEGINAAYNGLYLTGNDQHIDNHTLADHAKPHCFSNEVYKGILGGSSRGVFNGKIIVRQDAQKTNAYQSNKNIILTKTALMNTKPQLEIFADDVRCTHGATIGQLEDEQIFYLRSRGIDERSAKNILIHAFANDVIELMRSEPLKEYTGKFVFEHLNKYIEQN